MARTLRKLEALSEECERRCKEAGWVGPKTGKPNFRLLYSGIRSYESGYGVAILGLNPAGGLEDADNDVRNRGFREHDYSAYLDDNWQGAGRGQSRFQRAVQAIAMILTGTNTHNAITAYHVQKTTPEDRIGAKAEALLRNAPSGNINPFRTSTYIQLRKAGLDKVGLRIGWDLLCLAQPKPRVIVTLANGKTAPPWHTILRNSEQSTDSDYCMQIRSDRSYREVKIRKGPLKGALLIGLPAIVYQPYSRDVTPQLFDILAQRVEDHDLI